VAAIITWAVSVDGRPVYSEHDATTGLQERPQDNTAGDVVDAAGTVFRTTADGIPLDGAGNPIPQASQAIWTCDLALSYIHLVPYLPPLAVPPVVPAVPGPPGAPIFAAFALNPGQVAMGTVIGYTTSEGQQIFWESTKSLFAKSNKFALSADRIQPFLQTLKARGIVNGWDFNVSVGDVIVGQSGFSWIGLGLVL
jgi:hypothetical protein